MARPATGSRVLHFASLTRVAGLTHGSGLGATPAASSETVLMTFARVVGVMLAGIIAFGGGCSDSDVGRCISDDDCTRRESCRLGQCVASDGDARDAGDSDGAGEDATEADGDLGVEVAPPDPCGGRCATDELCSVLGACFCTPGLVRGCTSKGECNVGQRVCVDGAWSECESLPVDAVEVCDAERNPQRIEP